MLDILANNPYIFGVTLPPEFIDIPLGVIPDLFSITYLSPYDTLPDHGKESRESIPSLYLIS